MFIYFLILSLSKPLEQNLLEEYIQGGEKQKETTKALNLADGLMCTNAQGFNRKLCMHDCQQDYPQLSPSNHRKKEPVSENDYVHTSQIKALNDLNAAESMVTSTSRPALQQTYTVNL